MLTLKKRIQAVLTASKAGQAPGPRTMRDLASNLAVHPATLAKAIERGLDKPGGVSTDAQSASATSLAKIEAGLLAPPRSVPIRCAACGADGVDVAHALACGR